MGRCIGGNIDGEWQTDKVVLLAFVIVLGVVSMVIRGTGSDSGDSDGSDNEVDPYGMERPCCRAGHVVRGGVELVRVEDRRRVG